MKSDPVNKSPFNLFNTVSITWIKGVFIIALFSISQMANQFVLGIHLDKSDFGRYSFIFSNLIRFLPILFIFGLDNSLFSFFSGKQLSHYKWKGMLLAYLSILLILNIFLGYAITSIYSYELCWWPYISISFFIASSNQLLTSILASEKSFNLCHFLNGSHSAVFLTFLVYIFYVNKAIHSINLVLILKLFSLAIPLFILWKIFLFKESGEKIIPKSIFIKSKFLWAFACMNILFFSFDFVVLPFIFDFKTIGTFNVLFLFVQVYYFASGSLRNILIFNISSKGVIRTKKILIEISLICLALSMLAILFGPHLLENLFNHKYFISNTLAILFCLYGCIELFNLLPSTIIIGSKLLTKQNQLLLAGIILICFKLLLIFSFRCHLNLEKYMIMILACNLLRWLVLMGILKDELNEK